MGITRTRQIRNESFLFFYLCVFVFVCTCVVTQKDVSYEWLNDFLLGLSSSKCQNYSVNINEKTEVSSGHSPFFFFLFNS